MIGTLLACLSAALVACSSPSFFPPAITADVKANRDFGVMMAKPDAFKGSAVQVAGRIVGVQAMDDETLIIAQRLPVQHYPAYGPVDTRMHGGQFAVLYPGKLDPAALWIGNKFIVAADMLGAKSVDWEGVSRPEPYLVARCMHVWKTGQYYEISDFPYVTDGFYPLEEQTYCAA
ncbi:MAG: hypothetical protein C4293_04275 [Nitrospiraceae bacterium]